jgi:hypothetical protein
MVLKNSWMDLIYSIVEEYMAVDVHISDLLCYGVFFMPCYQKIEGI